MRKTPMRCLVAAYPAPKKTMAGWYAGPANEPVVSHADPTDNAVRQGPTWN
jgi:hypothetical protein